ncbi:MAG: rhomboid family intramembrane serine protease [Mycobacteriales bacterium]
MTAASVGFQCPECIREGRKTVRQARTIAGAPVSADSPVTRALLGLNVGIFLLVFLGVGGRTPQGFNSIVERFLMSPGHIALEGQYYRLVTSTFLHMDMLHIAFNMYALLSLGDQVERVLGRWRYLSLYFAAGLAGSAASYFFRLGPSLGASGAIFGLFGAYFVIQRRLRADTSSIVVSLVLNIFIAVAIPRIDWRAHVGGLVAGATITAGFIYLGRGKQRAPLHIAVVAAVALLTVAAIVVRTQQIRDLAGG